MSSFIFKFARITIKRLFFNIIELRFLIALLMLFYLFIYLFICLFIYFLFTWRLFYSLLWVGGRGRERGEEREKEREKERNISVRQKHWLAASICTLTRDQTHSPSECPDWAWTINLSGHEMTPQPTKPHQTGMYFFLTW